MEPHSRDRLAEQFPDIVEDLAAVVPDGGAVVRLEDAWVFAPAAEGSRLRTVDIAPPAGGPPTSDQLAQLLADGAERARQAGWKQVDRQEEEHRDVFRRLAQGERQAAPAFLRVWPGEVDYPTANVRAARFDLEQTCPWNRMQAAIADQMIHTLVRDQWKLTDPIRSVRLEILFDPDDLGQMLVLRQRVELPTTDALHDAIDDGGLDLVGRSRDRYARVERFTKGELTTAVALDDDLAIVALELNRTRRLR